MSESSVQSPTISSIDSNSSSANVTAPLSHEAHEKMKRIWRRRCRKLSSSRSCSNRKTKGCFGYWDSVAQTDFRIKLLEEEHARHQIVCNPELTSALYGGRRRNAPRRNKRQRMGTSPAASPTTSTPSPSAPSPTPPPTVTFCSNFWWYALEVP